MHLKVFIGWTGHKDGYPSTVFISKDQNYIVGDLFNAQNQNLSEQAINQHVKSAVLDEIWKSLEKSTWIQDGNPDAPKTIYVNSVMLTVLTAIPSGSKHALGSILAKYSYAILWWV